MNSTRFLCVGMPFPRLFEESLLTFFFFFFFSFVFVFEFCCLWSTSLNRNVK